MAYKRLSDAMSGKAPPPAKKKAPEATQVINTKVKPYEGPKSEASTRDKWARAMNAGDRATADKLYAQMKSEEAAANVAGKLKR